MKALSGLQCCLWAIGQRVLFLSGSAEVNRVLDAKKTLDGVAPCFWTVPTRTLVMASQHKEWSPLLLQNTTAHIAYTKATTLFQAKVVPTVP